MFKITALVSEAVGLLRGIDTTLEMAVRLAHRNNVQGRYIMSAIDDLIEQVKKNTSVELSAVQAINGLIAEVAQHAADNNDEKLKALTASLASSASALAAAIPASTPAALPTTAADPAPATEPAPAADPSPEPAPEPAPAQDPSADPSTES